MGNSNKKKYEQLGMPLGTAQNRLKKLILFALIQDACLDNCFQCGKKIKKVQDLSIEHKVPWLDNDVKLFWDLENIAFSHLKCNSASARKPNKIEWPEGQAWCNKCKKFKDADNFRPSKFTKNRDYKCNKCHAKEMNYYRKIQKGIKNG